MAGRTGGWVRLKSIPRVLICIFRNLTLSMHSCKLTWKAETEHDGEGYCTSFEDMPLKIEWEMKKRDFNINYLGHEKKTDPPGFKKALTSTSDWISVIAFKFLEVVRISPRDHKCLLYIINKRLHGKSKNEAGLVQVAQLDGVTCQKSIPSKMSQTLQVFRS